ncbi:hypothetical protein ACFSCW_07120 [Sphingomonas tabacisoli]|uniref:Uncharacterized protein n=1 Tax=Sphingomonas tabacisoli TaxID=2249466 RepID=A0ABW4I403_9SPHN
MASLDETRIAPATSKPKRASDEAARASTETEVNEIVKTAQDAKRGEEKAGPENKTAWIAAGVGVGIGSAALVAALLYANRDKGKKKG